MEKKNKWDTRQRVSKKGEERCRYRDSELTGSAEIREQKFILRSESVQILKL